MRTILLAALLVLATGAARGQDLSATFAALAQGAQAQAAARTADARSLRAALDRLLSVLGARPEAAAVAGQRPAGVLAAALSGPPGGTRPPPAERP